MRSGIHRVAPFLVPMFLFLFLLPLAGCGDSDDDPAGPTTTGDTFTVIIDGGAGVTYTETTAGNSFGYDPYIVAWVDTVNTQIHLFVSTGVGTTVDFITAISYDPPGAVGVPVNYQEARYEYGWDMATDPASLATNGTINISATAAVVGGVITGTFTGFSGFTPAGSITTLAGSFRATREIDDLF